MEEYLAAAVVITGALLSIARVVVKFTKTDKDDKVVKRIGEALGRFIG